MPIARLFAAAALVLATAQMPPALPLPSPVPAPGAQAAPSPSPLPTPLVLPDNAPPQILAVMLSDPVFHSGETVSGTIVTSTNVASVQIHLAGHTVHIPQTHAGIWEWTYRLPHIPFFLRGRYTAQIQASNGAGSVERDLPISVR